MVAKNLLTDVLALHPKDRIGLAERIWDSLAEDADSLPLSEAAAADLDDRLAAYRRNPDEGSTWDEVEARIRAKL